MNKELQRLYKALAKTDDRDIHERLYTKIEELKRGKENGETNRQS